MDLPSQNALQNLVKQSQHNGLSNAEIGFAVAQYAATQWQDFLRGLWLYHHHTAERLESDWQIVTQTNAVALKRLIPPQAKTIGTVFLVPSLINRFHILDLHPDQSFARFLQQCGYDVYLLDWHHDTTQAVPSSIDQCITDHIAPALATFKHPPHVIGYCMGGTLSVLAAAQNAKQIQSLTLFATPWDFHQPNVVVGQQFGAALQQVSHGMHITAEWLQMLFWQRDSLSALHKFRNFAHGDMQDLRATLFVLAEDWLNNGVDLPKTLLRDCAESWFNQNEPLQTAVETLHHIPILNITAKRDKLVPPASSAALHTVLPHSVFQSFETGHIGLFAGQKSHAQIWPQVQQFMLEHNH